MKQPPMSHSCSAWTIGRPFAMCGILLACMLLVAASSFSCKSLGTRALPDELVDPPFVIIQNHDTKAKVLIEDGKEIAYLQRTFDRRFFLKTKRFYNHEGEGKGGELLSVLYPSKSSVKRNRDRLSVGGIMIFVSRDEGIVSYVAGLGGGSSSGIQGGAMPKYIEAVSFLCEKHGVASGQDTQRKRRSRSAPSKGRPER